MAIKLDQLAMYNLILQEIEMTVQEHDELTHFSPMSHFYTS